MATAFYRKYRPDNFENIVGQNQVIDVLRNQIKDKKISHAYLFSGVRGTGKTSTAKVFARAVNCQNYDEVKGPCNHCESCLNNDMDTMEIDAASNNSVDNIRELKENIMYQPTFGKYRVYIIDEVHMLSAGAFNALLKTLEEPPSHVIFILATTEMQKIPATILSRCQKFEFKKISQEEIKNRLEEILKNENIDYEEQAIDYIASISDGGLRDAISMLDQVSSFEKVNREAIEFILGNTSIENVDKFLEGYISQDATKCLEITLDIINDSTDIKKFPLQIINRLREILHIQNKIEKKDTINIEKAKEISQKISSNQITDLIIGLSEIENTMKFSMTPDILFQAFAVKICKKIDTKDNTDNIQRLLNKIEQLENKINQLENRSFSSSPTQQQQNKVQIQKDVSRPSIQDIKPKEDISESEKIEIENLDSMVDDIKNMLKEEYRKAPIGAFYQGGKIRRFIQDTVFLSFPREFHFHKEKLEIEENHQILEQVISNLLKKPVKLVLLYDDELIDKNQISKKDQTIEKIKEVFGEDIDLEIINN